MAIETHTWGLYGLTTIELRALERWTFDTPERLRRYNASLYYFLRNRAIRMHYRRLKEMELGPLTMEDVRGLLSRLWCVGEDSIKKILYQDPRRDLWIGEN